MVRTVTLTRVVISHELSDDVREGVRQWIAMKLQRTPRTHRTRLGPEIGTPIGALGPRLGRWVQGTRTGVLTRWGVK